MPHYRLATSRRWTALTIAALSGLACVALLLAGGRAKAAPPDLPAGPRLPLPGPAPARLAPTAQTTPTICPLDVALVLDNSGSTEGDTICYDCWNKTSNDVSLYPYPANGTFYPISYTALVSHDLCVATSTPYTVGSNHYIIMEAELYARKSDVGWYRAGRTFGQGYWALQRGTTGSTRSSSIDGDFAAGGSRSAQVAHHPYWTYSQQSPPAPQLGRFYTLTDTLTDPTTPRLEYDFTPDWDGNASIWIRAMGGGKQSFQIAPVGASYQRNADKVYWAVDDDTPAQSAGAPTCNAAYDYAGCYLSYAVHDDSDCATAGSEDVCSTHWGWIRLGSVPVTSDTLHTLKLWAGSSGYEVDKIVITNNSATTASGLDDALTANSSRGRPATPGSARGGAPETQAGACDPCNPIYGLTVNPSNCTTPYYPVTTTTNRLQDELFGDREPLRGMQESAKRFAQRLNPQFDQVGVVGFDYTVNQQAELICLRRQTILGNPAQCYIGTWAISFTNAFVGIESQTASGPTNIGEAMRNGLEVLGYNVDDRSGVDNLCDGMANSACARGGAKRVMILLTDGSPNAHTGEICHSDNLLWPYNSDPSFDCVMYYAQKAHARGITIYTIGVGDGVVPELLQAVADEAGGEYYWAASVADLDAIYDDILPAATASCVPFKLSMSPDGAQSGSPGQSLTYTHVLTNFSYYEVTVSLTYTVDPAGWPVSVGPASRVLWPGEAMMVTAVVTVPPGALGGRTGVVRLVATLQENETISATVVDTTTVDLTYRTYYLPVVFKGG